MGKRLRLLFGLLLFAAPFIAFIPSVEAANNCVSIASSNWNAPSTWTSCGGSFPGSADTATIASGHIVTVNVNSAAASLAINANSAAGGNGVTISSGMTLAITGGTTMAAPTAATTDLNVGDGSLSAASIAITGGGSNRFATVSVNNGTVTTTGSITFAGTAARARYTSTAASTTNIGGDFGAGGTLTTSGTGTFNFDGVGAQVINAYTTYNNIQINNGGGGVSFGGTTTIGGTLLVNTGILDMGNVSPTVTGATTINSTLRVSSTGGTKTSGDITIANGGSLSFTAAEGLSINGNLMINGTGAISGTTGTLVFQKAGGGSIGGTTASTQTIAAATFSTNYSNAIALTVTGTTSISSGITVTNSGTFTASGTLSGATGTFTQAANGVLNIGSTSTINTLNATAIPNAVHYTSTSAAQTIKATTYYDLFIEKTGQVGTLGATTTVNRNLTISSGSLADGGFQIAGSASGSLSMASGTTLTLGTVAATTSFPTGFVAANISLNVASTVIYNSNLAQSISATPSYGNLTMSATAAVTKTAAGNLVVNGLLTNGANNVLADGGFTLTLKDGSVMTGTHSGTGKILFTGGSSAHSVSGTGSYNNIELDDINGVNQSGTIIVNGTFTITSGSWTVNANSLTVTGNTSISGTLAINNTTGTKTFGNVTISSGGLVSFSAAEAVTLNGNLTVNGTGSVTGSSGIWTFSKVGGGSISGTATSLTISGGNTFTTNYSVLLPYTAGSVTVTPGVNVTNFTVMTLAGISGGSGTFTQRASSSLYLNGSAAVTIGTLDASANPNEVHYTNTTASQTVKVATYYNLFIDKASQTATMSSGNTNVLGNLTVTAGILTLGLSTLNVNGTTDIHGTLDDINNTGSATFGGLATVYPSGNWTGNPAKACDFNFKGGFAFNGTSFTSGAGIYTFMTNNQSISGSSAISAKNLVVSGIQLTNSSTAPLSVGTSLSGTGELIQDVNAILDIGGTSTIATLTAGATGNTVNYTGSAAQTVKAAEYSTLDVSANTSTSVNLTADVIVDSSLVLGATKLSTGSSKIIIAAAASVSRTSGYVIGTIRKQFDSSTSFTYVLGDGSNYVPISLVVAGVSGSGSVDSSITNGDHPDIANSGINAAKSVNRYWSLVNNGLSFASYDTVLNFAAGDVDAGAIVSNMVVTKKSSGSWVILPSSCSGTACSVNGLTTMSDFQAGEPVDQTPPNLILESSAAGTASVTSNNQANGFTANNPTVTPANKPHSISASPSSPGGQAALFDVAAESAQPKRQHAAIVVVATVSFALGCLLGALLLAARRRLRHREIRSLV